MENYLLVTRLNQWISKGNPPDELSIEFGEEGTDNDDPVIFFRWFGTNNEKTYSYSSRVYQEVMKRFNQYWNGSRLD